SVGYNGGAFDGRFFYAAPWQQGRKPGKQEEFVTHGTVLRCDTLGDSGSFSLRWSDCGHNGGLNAAVIGPSFLVNTTRGCVRASSPCLLSPGRHHLAGTYDGAVIRLYVDGQCIAEQPGGSPMIACDLPVTVGHIQDGAGTFRGRILQTAVIATVTDAGEIARMASLPPEGD
ncbi:MAG: hypothetical protein HOH74_17305, partial [Gemmatimonadetes bacterium]|nr:hypothetical protein [Gemmatimonadota bacterium]